MVTLAGHLAQCFWNTNTVWQYFDNTKRMLNWPSLHGKCDKFLSNANSTIFVFNFFSWEKYWHALSVISSTCGLKHYCMRKWPVAARICIFVDACGALLLLSRACTSNRVREVHHCTPTNHTQESGRCSSMIFVGIHSSHCITQESLPVSVLFFGIHVL